MNIRSTRNRAVISLTRSELDGYGVQFSSMSLDDLPTRVMLGDILRLLAHMGVINDEGRSSRLTIECTKSRKGDCTIVLHNVIYDDCIANGISGVLARLYLFDDANEICAAAKAGALQSEDIIYTAQNGCYAIYVTGDITAHRAMLLGEFGRAI